MSSVMIRFNPASCASVKAPATPPAGPDSAVRTAKFPAAFGLTLPPFDDMTRSRSMPYARMPLSSRDRYRSITGAT